MPCPNKKLLKVDKKTKDFKKGLYFILYCVTYPFLTGLGVSGDSEGCPGSDSESIEILNGDLKLRNVKLSTESIEELNMNSVALVRHSLPVRR